MDISWEDARLFLAVAEAGSVSAAARALKITQPTASRRLAQLEATLGDAVFVRRASGAALTPLGERLLAPARRMAESAGELQLAAARTETRIEGVVRITAPPSFAYDFCVPFAASLRERLPGVRLEIASTVRYVDLARGEADLAIRFERTVLRDQTCLSSLTLDVAAFADAKLAERIGPRPKARDLPWVGWAPPLDALPPSEWLTRRIPGWKPSFASDDWLVQVRAAELGLGAIVLGRIRHPFLRATTLVEIPVTDLPATKTTLSLVCAKRALEVPRIRAVGEMLAEEMARCETQKPRRKARRR